MAAYFSLDSMLKAREVWVEIHNENKRSNKLYKHGNNLIGSVRHGTANRKTNELMRNAQPGDFVVHINTTRNKRFIDGFSTVQRKFSLRDKDSRPIYFIPLYDYVATNIPFDLFIEEFAGEIIAERKPRYYPFQLKDGRIDPAQSYFRRASRALIRHFVSAIRDRLGLYVVRNEQSEDINAIVDDPNIDETTRTALIKARLGQDIFRTRLEQKWDNKCAVTNCVTRTILKASHIRSWRSSNNRERLDGNNGLLLVAHLDALFDVGLISFDDNGEMIVSGRINLFDQECLNLGGKLTKQPWPELTAYLAEHRKQHKEEF
jgi:hypothetical protein